MSLPAFKPLDRRIRHYELLLERDLKDLPCYDLPKGFHIVTYQEGDREKWIRIEKSAGEFATYEEGVDAWNRYYAGHEVELPGRMFFVEEETDRKVATATAYHDIYGRDTTSAFLHWVAVAPEAQGKGLSKPLISHVLHRMASLNETWVKVPTQTTSWIACKVYLDLGFRPIEANKIHSREGWCIIRRLTGHPALAEFPAAEEDQVLVQKEKK